jgi:hypothetical protein
MLCAVAQMTQLTYQAAFDPFHAVFRIVRLTPIIAAPTVVLQDVVRILDFYLLFPFRINELRLNPGHKKYKKLYERYESSRPYGDQPDSRSLFERMQPMQSAAQETLAAQNILEPRLLAEHKIQLIVENVPPELATRAEEVNQREADLIEFLAVLATEYELMGANGIKARSGLMEFRYDAI